MKWLYSEKVKEHFKNPRNFLKEGEEFEADGRGEVGNPKCGDMMLVLIRVEDDRIEDIRWQTYGCASAIASTSAMSELVKGMALDEAYEIGYEEIVRALGGLPDNKVHCSVLGDQALREAIDDYREDEVVCYCYGTKKSEIEKYDTLEEVRKETKAGTACGQCEKRIKEILND